MTQHTPGPWAGCDPISPEETLQLLLDSRDKWRKRAKALLVVAKDAKEDLGCYGLHTDEPDCPRCVIRKRLVAAIAKAEGES